ncbi:hypothetical protein [Prosthecobacter sp.]|uniref:hypothetical protein n=1 Tax=Prosthecobacter sp. TaxID=1965333 RepID=UPI00248A3B00|nr:hypothetical protein [Prosthecobacter sp.]MDI1312508.1 hypothetical protein [Prosthecobacter sp.]
MSGLALEVDQTLQQLDAVTASRLERLVRDALALVRTNSPLCAVAGQGASMIRFPLVQGGKSITNDDVARLEDE